MGLDGFLIPHKENQLLYSIIHKAFLKNLILKNTRDTKVVQALRNCTFVKLTKLISTYSPGFRINVGMEVYYSHNEDDIISNYDINMSTSAGMIIRKKKLPHIEEWNFYTGEQIVQKYNLICKTDKFLNLHEDIQEIYTNLKDACLKYPNNVFIGSC